MAYVIAWCAIQVIGALLVVGIIPKFDRYLDGYVFNYFGDVENFRARKEMTMKNKCEKNQLWIEKVKEGSLGSSFVTPTSERGEW